MTLTPGHFPNEQRSTLRAVALAYRRAYRAELHKASAAMRRCGNTGAYAPMPRADQLAASSEVNRMVAAAINANARWFWHGPDV